jgi:hypothetical protein
MATPLETEVYPARHPHYPDEEFNMNINNGEIRETDGSHTTGYGITTATIVNNLYGGNLIMAKRIVYVIVPSRSQENRNKNQYDGPKVVYVGSTGSGEKDRRLNEHAAKNDNPKLKKWLGNNEHEILQIEEYDAPANVDESRELDNKKEKRWIDEYKNNTPFFNRQLV